MNFTELYIQLSDASLHAPQRFAQQLTNALASQLEVDAVSFFVNAPESATVRLKAQTGLSYDRYPSYQLGMRTLAGRAIGDRATIVELNIPGSPFATDSQVTEASDLKFGASIPLFRHELADIDSPGVIGAVCIYSSTVESLVNAKEGIERLQPLLARLYLASLQHWFQRIRSYSVREFAFQQRLGDMCEEFVKMIAEELTFEAATVFVCDEGRNRTYLRGTTGLRDDLEANQISFQSDHKNLIATAIRRRSVIVHTNQNLAFDADKVPERLESSLTNGIALPLQINALSGAGSVKPQFVGIGCLILINNYAEFDGVRRLVEVTWEERAIAELAAEMLSVLVYQTQRARDLEHNYERLMHGAAQTLQGALFNIELIEDEQVMNRDETGRLSIDEQYWLADASSFVSDVQTQVRRGELVDEVIPIRTVALHGEILSNLRSLVGRLCHARGLGAFTFDYDDPPDGWLSFPGVKGDSDALQCVFRNLIDNALKYHSETEATHLMRLSGTFDQDEVRIRLADSGMLISEADSTRLFEDGFRGYRARLRTPSGIGKGLADCRIIKQKMGGNIEYLGRIDGLTTFEVSMRRARRR